MQVWTPTRLLFECYIHIFYIFYILHILYVYISPRVYKYATHFRHDSDENEAANAYGSMAHTGLSMHPSSDSSRE